MFFQFFTSLGWSSNKWSLLFLNTFAGALLIVLSHSTAFPLSDVNFFFFSFIGLLFALYRPAWVFLLLVGMLPYEIIDLMPLGYGNFSLRPYQWLVVLLSFSLVIRYFLKRFPVEKFTPRIWDFSILVVGMSAFLSASMSTQPATAFKLSLILLSFILFYFITRLFIRSLDDGTTLLPFILSSFLVVSIYALVQNIFFLNGIESNEVMSGRPNATFSEADWLGGYLSTLLVLLSALILFFENRLSDTSFRVLRYIFSFLLFIGAIALLLSVSRSAWLATFAGIGTLVILFLKQNQFFQAVKTCNRDILLRLARTGLLIVLPFIVALLIISLFRLSPFDLLDRSRSTATGEQKITVACPSETILPAKIASTEELISYGCVHIRLEEIESKKNAGEYVTEIFRNDPNVHIRASIYVRVFQILKEHPYFGIGLGNISSFLGTDERGTGLNASNIFLEIWLGTGIVGFVAFLFFWCGLLWQGILSHFRQISSLLFFLLPLWVTLTVFNLFNSGLMLGFFFFFLALLPTLDSRTDKNI